MISEVVRRDYFAQHYDLRQSPPNAGSGPFFTAVAAKLPAETIREVMETTASTFTPVLSKSDILGVSANHQNLYDFAIEVLPQRETILFTDFTAAITGLTTLSMADELQLWDNLFYQTITLESPYVREVLIHVLLANHIVEVNGSASTPTNDDEARKLCQSRLVMPIELFAIEDNYRAASTEASIGPDAELLEKNINSLENNLLAKWAATAFKEVEVIERDYWATEKALEVSAVDTYISTMEANVDGVTLKTTPDNDPFTGIPFAEFDSPLNPPSYTYTPSPQVDAVEITGDLTATSGHILNSNNLLVATTFSDLRSDISQYISGRNDEIFQNTDFGLESIEVNGTAIPTCHIENRYNQKYSYMIRALKKYEDTGASTDIYAIMFAVDIGSSCTRLRDMDFTINGVQYNRFKASNTNGVVTIHVTQGGAATVADTLSSVTASGTLIFDNGLTLTFNDPLELDDYGSTGYMVATDGQTGNENLFVPSDYGLTQLGIDEYRRVEQYICCYEPGEVAHIENILAKEYKERSTRRLRRSEETTTLSFESETENLTDTTSTTRFDMQKEASEVLSKSREFGAHAEVYANASGEVNTGLLGEVSFSAGGSAGANFSTSTSKEKSSRQAANFAEDITKKALERVVSKVSEQRTTKIIEEFEENNRHGFDNRLGTDHVSGVYRWVDKIYKNEVQNYGKRLQYEFMIPEPAAFHLIAKKRGASSSNRPSIVKPLDPRSKRFGSLSPLKSSAALNENNYQQWAAIYNAEVSPPPPSIQLVGKSFKKETPDPTQWYKPYAVTDQLIIPEGYGLNKAYVSGQGAASGQSKTSGYCRFSISVADNTKKYWTAKLNKTLFLEDNKTLELDKYTDSVPVGVEFFWMHGGLVSISLELKRKEHHYRAWQLETFRAIISAYEDRLQEYNDSMAELEAKRGVLLSDNPKYYREIEQTVLRKNCIAYLIGHTNMGKSFVKGAKMGNNHVDISQEMDQYAATVKFFEQAFEWNIMSYRFYPFYWAGKNKWTELYDIDNEDATFKAFLQAGMARVILSVRPGFEESVLHYMSTGQIWDGGEVPVIGDDLYLSIVDELRNPEYTIAYSWETRVPSALTIVQAGSAGLNAPTNGLPCYCDSTVPDEDFSTDTTSMTNFVEGYSQPEPPA